jgi:hypothetical protein
MKPATQPVTRQKRIPEFFTWTVKLSVHKSWVADGFNLDDDRAHDMLANDLQSARGHELKAQVIATPDPEQIAKVQGYENAVAAGLKKPKKVRAA